MFTTAEWEYNSTHDIHGKTYDVWQRSHSEGYTAYAVTNHHIPPVKPMGDGHYTGEAAMKRKLGITITPN